MSIATLTPAGADWDGELVNAAFHAIVDNQPDPEPVFRRCRVSDWVSVNGSHGRRRTRERGER